MTGARTAAHGAGPAGLALATLLLICPTAPLHAQNLDSASLQRIRLALDSQPTPQSTLATPVWAPPERRTFGIVTLVPTESRGEIIRLSLPIGELATRGVRSIQNAKQRRAERKAREEVQAAMRQLTGQRP